MRSQLYFATAADVDTIIVNGKVLMRGREIKHLETDAILNDVARQTRLAFERTGLSHLLLEPSGYWSVAKRNFPA